MTQGRDERQAYELLHERVTGRALEPGGASISVAQYDAARLEYLDETGQESVVGKAVWPPTSQTIRHKLGGGSWASAMEALGLQANSGRARGASTFSESDYREALMDFMTAAAGEATATSYTAFASWVKQQKADGRRRPSAAAVRAHFGSWSAAKQAVTPDAPPS